MTDQELAEQRAQYVRAIFDTIPLPAFIVDEDVRIQDFNTAAEPLLGPEPAAALYCRGGEALHCIRSEDEGCGKGRWCHDCVIRNSIAKAMRGQSTLRQPHRAELRLPGGTVPVELLVTSGLLPYTDPPRALLILEDQVGTSTRPTRRGKRRG